MRAHFSTRSRLNPTRRENPTLKHAVLYWSPLRVCKLSWMFVSRTASHFESYWLCQSSSTSRITACCGPIHIASGLRCVVPHAFPPKVRSSNMPEGGCDSLGSSSPRKRCSRLCCLETSQDLHVVRQPWVRTRPQTSHHALFVSKMSRVKHSEHWCGWRPCAGHNSRQGNDIRDIGTHAYRGGRGRVCEASWVYC